MHNYNRHASVTTMLQHLDLPTLQQRRQHSKITMLYRITHKLASSPTTTYTTPATRNTQHYILPYAHTHVFKSSFFPSTIKIWQHVQLRLCGQSRAGQEYFTICKVLGMYSGTFLGNLQYLYLYLSTFQMYFDFQVLLEYI